MRGPVAIALVVVVAAGCSLGALDGFSGGDGNGDAGSSDASVDANGGGDASPANDGATNDASDAGDAGSDASGPFTCDGGSYLLCTTFDDGTLAAGWNMSFTGNGGTLGLSNDARTPTYAMHTELPAMTATGAQYARLYKKVTGANPIRVAFDVKMAAPAWNANDKAFAIVEVTFPTSNNSSYLFGEVAQTTLSIEQENEYIKVGDLAYGKWVRVALEIRPTPPTGSIVLTYDGKKAYENLAVTFETPTTPSTDVFIGLVRYDPPGPPIDVVYDNVTIEQIP